MIDMEKYTYFSEKRIREIERKIESIINENGRKIKDPRFIFLDNSGFIQLLGISFNTAKNWRQQHKITYSQINHKLYYRLSDISAMMEAHRVSSE